MLYPVGLLLLPFLASPQGSRTSGSIEGAADPGAQIVVTSEDGSVTGAMATCGGTYKVQNLQPGSYSIVEGGPHHAVRKLTVMPGAASQVDLGKATPESTQMCRSRKSK